MVYWALAELKLRSHWLGQPISRATDCTAIFEHVQWERDTAPLEDETIYYLDRVVANVSYAELLCAGRLWWKGTLNHLCIGSLHGTVELKAELERYDLRGDCRVD